MDANKGAVAKPGNLICSSSFLADIDTKQFPMTVFLKWRSSASDFRA
jgi:hypothetical protein